MADSLVDLVRADVHSEMDGMDSFEQTLSMSNREYVDHNPKVHRHIDDSEEKTMTCYTPYQETHVMIISEHHNAKKLLALGVDICAHSEERDEVGVKP